MKIWNWIWIIIIVIAVLIAPLLIYKAINLYGFEVDGDSIQPGTFGDQYGVLNTLFSGLAFLFIVLSFKSQREELSTYQNELESLKGEQARKNFEDQFYYLLKNYENQINQTSGIFIETKDDNTGLINKTYNGGKYFEALYREIKSLHNTFINPLIKFELIHDSSRVFKILESYGIAKQDTIDTYLSSYQNDYSKLLVKTIHDHRAWEFQNAFHTYLFIVRFLEEEYDRNVALATLSKLEVDKRFEIYTEILKSTNPGPIRLLFLYFYLSLIDKPFVSEHVIDCLFSELSPNNYLTVDHFKKLFPNLLKKDIFSKYR